MEGLIPYVYRAIKRRRTRRYYKCLSSGSNQLLISSSFRTPGPKFLTPPPEALGGFRGEKNAAGHRRHRSMEDFSGELPPEGFPEQGRLRRFRSGRMFACIAGA